MQWSFSNKARAVSQFLSFKASQDRDPRITLHDHSRTSRFMSISNADSGMVQKNVTFNEQTDNHHTDIDVHIRHEVGLSRFTKHNQIVGVSARTPLHSYPSFGQNSVSYTGLQQLGGVLDVAPVSVFPSPNSFVGTTDLRDTSQTLRESAKLTIFYAGAVHVYDDVSPEKAQAIMLLAGNDSLPRGKKTLSAAQVQAPFIRSSTSDGYIGKKYNEISSYSDFQTPIHVTSHIVSHADGRSISPAELVSEQRIRSVASCSTQPEPLRVLSSVRSATGNLVPPVALPLARKASLARFLEKRKERVTSTSPYCVSQKRSECSILPSCSLSGSPLSSSN